ncbi:MAG: flavin reductase family protein [Verrucomicrobiota bacterium]|nr:flavin reductase family protein [Verrucomicrobiota bacterium]
MNDAPDLKLKELAQAIGALPASLYVLTCEGEYAIVSWVQQAGFVPPMISLALKHGRGVGEKIMAGSPFHLSILPENGMKLAKPFFSSDAPGISAALDLEVLKDAHGYLQCKYVRHTESGDHSIVIAEVLTGKLLGKSEKPHIHLRKDGLKY